MPTSYNIAPETESVYGNQTCGNMISEDAHGGLRTPRRGRGTIFRAQVDQPEGDPKSEGSSLTSDRATERRAKDKRALPGGVHISADLKVNSLVMVKTFAEKGSGSNYVLKRLYE